MMAVIHVSCGNDKKNFKVLFPNQVDSEEIDLVAASLANNFAKEIALLKGFETFDEVRKFLSTLDFSYDFEN